jgi:hypothetical protein
LLPLISSLPLPHSHDQQQEIEPHMQLFLQEPFRIRLRHIEKQAEGAEFPSPTRSPANAHAQSAAFSKLEHYRFFDGSMGLSVVLMSVPEFIIVDAMRVRSGASNYSAAWTDAVTA